jgi:hypothetical protein
VHLRHRLPGPERLQARSHLVLQLEQLDQSRRVGRGGHGLQPAAFVGQHDAAGVGVHEVHGALDQRVQELDEVELVHQRVRELDEGVRDA